MVVNSKTVKSITHFQACPTDRQCVYPDLTFNVYAKSEPSDAPWGCGTRLNVLTKGLSNQNINIGCEASAVIPEVTNRQKGWCCSRSSTISSDMNSPSLHQEGVSPRRGLPVHLEPGEGQSEVSTRSGWKHSPSKTDETWTLISSFLIM